MQGTIKHWNIPGGYGFISPDQSNIDVFVHASEFAEYRNKGRDAPVSGLRVFYDLKPSAVPGRADVAANVRTTEAAKQNPAPTGRSRSDGATLMAEVFGK